MSLEFQFVHPLPDWLNRQWKANSNKNSNECGPSFVLTTGLRWSILISKLGSGFSIAMTISLVLLANSVVYSDGSISITTWGLSVPLSPVSLRTVITFFFGFFASVSSSFFLRRATNSCVTWYSYYLLLWLLCLSLFIFFLEKGNKLGLLVNIFVEIGLERYSQNFIICSCWCSSWKRIHIHIKWHKTSHW